MCKDCGCSVTDHVHSHTHTDEFGNEYTHTHGDHHHDHSHAHQAAHETLHHNPQLNDAKTISIIKKILDKNDQEAVHNREHFEAWGFGDQYDELSGKRKNNPARKDGNFSVL